jgi:hypothetical protein
MLTSIVSITFLVGLAVIVVALLGGGIVFEKLTIPALPIIPRILSGFFGLALMALCVIRPETFLVFSGDKNPPVPPPNLSPKMNPSSPQREEQDEVESYCARSADSAVKDYNRMMEILQCHVEMGMFDRRWSSWYVGHLIWCKAPYHFYDRRTWRERRAMITSNNVGRGRVNSFRVVSVFDLGILQSKGACWENLTARLCAWR